MSSMSQGVELYKVHYSYRRGNMSTSKVLYFENRDAMEQEVFQLAVNMAANHHDISKPAWRMWRAWKDLFMPDDDPPDMQVLSLKVWKMTSKVQGAKWIFEWLELKVTTTPPGIEVSI